MNPDEYRTVEAEDLEAQIIAEKETRVLQHELKQKNSEIMLIRNKMTTSASASEIQKLEDRLIPLLEKQKLIKRDILKLKSGEKKAVQDDAEWLFSGSAAPASSSASSTASLLRPGSMASVKRKRYREELEAELRNDNRDADYLKRRQRMEDLRRESQSAEASIFSLEQVENLDEGYSMPILRPDSKELMGGLGADVEGRVSQKDVVLDGGLYIPAEIWANLLDYQKEGVEWLWGLHSQNVGGIVGDEMGLGKTIQIISFLASLHYSNMFGPSLIVCPSSVMRQWVRELHKWWPPFRVFLFPMSETKRARAALVRKVLSDGHILVLSYETLRSHREVITQGQWEYIVLDEGHKIRNPETEVAMACKAVNTPHRLILTGTPIQNRLSELWSLFDFVFPGKLGTLQTFLDEFAKPIQSGGYSSASSLTVQAAYKCSVILRDLIRPYIMRRLKKSVATQLPKKTEQIVYCYLTPMQVKMYRRVLASEDVQAVLERGTMPFRPIITLRKICNHPLLFEEQEMRKSGIDLSQTMSSYDAAATAATSASSTLKYKMSASRAVSTKSQRKLHRNTLDSDDPAEKETRASRRDPSIEGAVPTADTNCANNGIETTGGRAASRMGSDNMRTSNHDTPDGNEHIAQTRQNIGRKSSSSTISSSVSASRKKPEGLDLESDDSDSDSDPSLLDDHVHDLADEEEHMHTASGSGGIFMHQSSVFAGQELLICRPGTEAYRRLVETSGKLKLLLQMLRKWFEGGHKVLLFSQTRQMLDILHHVALCEGYNCVRLDGSTAIPQRMNVVDAFNRNEDIFLFLLTTRAGGLGLNLTGADRVVIFDPDWNPATDAQARERCWRLGQKKPVEVVRFMTAGTIEEKIHHRQVFKKYLTDRVLKDPALRSSFRREDLHELFTLKEEYYGPDGKALPVKQPGATCASHESASASAFASGAASEKSYVGNDMLDAVSKSDHDLLDGQYRIEQYKAGDERRQDMEGTEERLIEQERNDSTSDTSMLRSIFDDPTEKHQLGNAKDLLGIEAELIAKRAARQLVLSQKKMAGASLSSAKTPPRRFGGTASTMVGRGMPSSGGAMLGNKQGSGSTTLVAASARIIQNAQDRHKQSIEFEMNRTASYVLSDAQSTIRYEKTTSAEKHMSADSLSVEKIAADPDRGTLLADLCAFFRKQPGKRASSADVLAVFKSRVKKGDEQLFKEMLRQVASLEDKHWYLKLEFYEDPDKNIQEL
eukprot:ANDGO_04440.mRNA.1 DNA repair protein rhp26